MQAFPESIISTGGLHAAGGTLCAITARQPLEFWQFAVGYCLDAPDWLPVGSVCSSALGAPMQAITSREAT